jgi:hypothetical protein
MVDLVNQLAGVLTAPLSMFIDLVRSSLLKAKLTINTPSGNMGLGPSLITVKQPKLIGKRELLGPPVNGGGTDLLKQRVYIFLPEGHIFAGRRETSRVGVLSEVVKSLVALVDQSCLT